MKRGDIYFADLNPTVGDEIQKKRPVLVVSCNANNKMANTVTIVPITSNTTKCYPFEVLLPGVITGLKKDSKAQCHQIRTISTKRIISKKCGSLDTRYSRRVDEAIKTHLDL